jgi:hypothetical protein
MIVNRFLDPHRAEFNAPAIQGMAAALQRVDDVAGNPAINLPPDGRIDIERQPSSPSRYSPATACLPSTG